MRQFSALTPDQSPLSQPALTLISHPLCPYVQRAAISLTEKGMNFERIDIDLAAKPDWFVAMSPLGKTPVLKVGQEPIFESAVILEYLEETGLHPLHADTALARAKERGWVEFSSAVLNDIAAFYSAPDAAAFALRAGILRQRFARLEAALDNTPYFAGQRFGLVDAAFAPVFRYFDVLDDIGAFGILAGFEGLARWRKALSARPSVQGSVRNDYPELLRRFFAHKGSHLSTLLAKEIGASHESLDAAQL